MSRTLPALLAMLGLAGYAGLGVARAADPFMVVVLPDTQNYSKSYPATFTAQTQWIADNAVTENILFVSHMGDIVQDWNKQQQWNRAIASMGILDAAGLPYGTVMGNHDGRSYQASYYLNSFGPQHYQGETWYGGASPSGLSNYQIISAGGMTFLFLHVQVDTPPAELTWAQGILDANRDKPVVFSTHRYLMDFRILEGRFWNYDIFGGTYEPDAVMSETLFQTFVKTNKNIFLVLCGHIAGQYHQVSQNDWGLPVYEILQDFDSYEDNGGNGWMRLLTFDVDANQIQVDMYSPTLGRFRLDGPKETHEDFQHTLDLMDDPDLLDEIIDIVLSIDPNFDVEAYIQWLTENGGENFWDLAYADGQRDSSFAMTVNFDAYITHQYALAIDYVNGTWGQVDVAPEPNDPNLFQYTEGTPVTLTAVPIEGKAFTHWEVYDPNHPGDANHVAIDANNPLTIMMDADREVTAVFKCGSGVGIGPLLMAGLAICGVASRRMRRNGGPGR